MSVFPKSGSEWRYGMRETGDGGKKKKRVFLLSSLFCVAGLAVLFGLLFAPRGDGGGRVGGGISATFYTVEFRYDGRPDGTKKEIVSSGGFVGAPPETAEIAGKVLVGWFEDGATTATVFPYRPFKDITLRAVYASAYNVRFFSSVGVSPESRKVRDYLNEAYLELPALGDIGRNRFDGWFTDLGDPGTKAGALYRVEKDTDFYAKWTRTFEVSFAPQGGVGSDGNAPRPRFAGGNESISLPVLTKPRFAFDGWYLDARYTSFAGGAGDDYTVGSDAVLYAKWAAAYTVHFEANGGSATKSVAARADAPVLTELPAPAREGDWEFGGWYEDNGSFAASVTAPYTVTGEEVTLYAKWNRVYTLSFITRGGSGETVAPLRVSAGQSVGVLPAPSPAPGYVFTGWYLNSGATGFRAAEPYAVNSSHTLYMGYVPGLHAAVFETNGGNFIAPLAVARGGDTINLPVPTRGGDYEFGGWFSDSALTRAVTSPYAVTSSCILYAKWAAVHTVTFVTHIGRPAQDTLRVRHGQTLTETQLYLNAAVEFAFVGWYSGNALGGTQITSATPINSDMTLYALWSDMHLLAFSTDVGVAPEPFRVPDGTAVTLSRPTYSGAAWEFAGWFENPQFTVAAQSVGYAVTRSLTLYAKWTYDVQYNAYGIASLSSEIRTKGVAGALNENISATGWRFDGWFRTDGVFNDADRVANYSDLSDGNVILYAKWSYEIRYDMNAIGQMSPNPEWAVRGYSADLPEPFAVGREFAGWYRNNGTAGVFDEGGRVENYIQLTAGATRLYAKWTYKITYDLDGLTDAAGMPDGNAETVTRGRTGALPAPNAAGWTFTGWYRDGVSFTQEVSDYSDLATVNITLYARWVRRVTFDTYGYFAVESRDVPRGAEGSLPETSAADRSLTFADRDTEVALNNRVTAYGDFGNITSYAKRTENDD